jgi:CRISPR-associated protein Cas2
MLTLVTYDIVKNNRRSRFHRFLKELGLNTQRSVFECDIDSRGLEKIKNAARSIVDPKTDSVRIYRLCERCSGKVEVSGQGKRVLRTDFEVL